MLEIEIDGKRLEVPDGSTVMEAANQIGAYVPHFCYHKKLSIAANCRMCLVQVEKAPKPLPACATPVTNGMKVWTHSEQAVKAQKGVMEFLLINHPLDCPICDQGGECQLQDLSVGYGGEASRYAEEKRVVSNKDLGSLVSTDMTRCINCTRCVRFTTEIAGLMELGQAFRGEHAEIMPFVEKTLESELSGNIIDLCPVGALTSKPFRFSARAWEMSRRRSVSPHDSLGSNLVVQVKNDSVKRVLPFENEAINECWLSDKDRFSYEALASEDRLTRPMIKQAGEWFGYIVYALAEAGYSDIKKEFDSSYKKAMETKDPYMLAMMVNAAYSLKETTKANEAMTALLSKQAKDGSFTGSTHSITYSQGRSLTIETTALSIMGMLKSTGKEAVAMNNAVQYLVSSRSGSGVFSSTQGTILALKALTEFAKFSKKTTESGAIHIYVDGKKVAERNYKAGDKGAIEIAGLEEYLSAEGKHDLKVKYVGVKTPLPYSVAVNWSTSLPNSDKECVVDLKTTLATNTAKVGETVRMKATVTNKKSTDVPSAMAIIGIPAGFTVQPWQLKEMQEKHVFDYYEMKGNNIAIYYRGMAPNAVKEINLDLKAEMPGVYDAPASSAYLYYTNEYKTWAGMEKITIKKG